MNYLVLILCGFTLWSCSSSGVERKNELEQEAKEEQIDDVKEEIRVGKVIAAKLAGKYGLYKNPDVLKYVNLVGKTVAQKSFRAELSFSFGILDTEELNAFAAPGGIVFLTRGILEQIKSEDELAAVLGHEIAHVMHKHLFDTIKPAKKKIGVQENIVRFIGKSNALELAINAIVGKGMDILLKDGLSQEKESEADSSGITIAYAAGYNPNGLPSFLKKLDELQEKKHKEELQKDPNAGVGSMEKTHPPAQVRMQNIQKFLAENGLSKATGKTLEDRFQKMCIEPMQKATKKT